MLPIRKSLLPVVLLGFVALGTGCPDEETDTDTDTDTGTETETETDDPDLTPAEFERATQIYFDRCSGCHGTLRKGATGPNLEPEATEEIGEDEIKEMLMNGTDAGMPPFGKLGILDEEEIGLLAKFLMLDAPTPPDHGMDEIKDTWNLIVPVAERPTEPPNDDWENYFGVILRDAGKVAIINGDTFKKVATLDSGYAVHILRASVDGRYMYSIGRDGKVTIIDLWYTIPKTVAEVRGCLDARSVDASKYEGFENKYLIEGCYWPPQYVVFDGETLEPKADTVITSSPAFDDPSGPMIVENRVAAIVASHHAPEWVINLKESGHVAIVDYSDPAFPMTSKIGSAKALHDGGWDSTGRYFMTAANASNKMVIIDTEDNKLEAVFETGVKPHPGRGANWIDPTFGPVNATTHIGEGKMSIYGTDPENYPENAWKVVREVDVEVGGLFVKTHPSSKWVWLDSPLNSEPDKTRQVCVYEKATGQINKCWKPTDHGRTVHFEYNADGTQVWISGWDNDGQLVIYDDATLTEVGRIDEDWLQTPTGKFNVYNTAYDVY